MLKISVAVIVTKGLDEELAAAVDKDFYENYKRWKMDHCNARTRQQVNLATGINSKSSSDPSVGEELECSSRGKSNTEDARRCHHEKETDRSHMAQGPNQK